MSRLSVHYGWLQDLAVRRVVLVAILAGGWVPLRAWVSAATQPSRRNLFLRGAVDGLLLLLLTSRICLGWAGQAPVDWFLTFEAAMIAGWLVSMRHLFRSAAVLSAAMGVVAVVLRVLPGSVDRIYDGSLLGLCLVLAVDAWWASSPDDRRFLTHWIFRGTGGTPRSGGR